MKNHLAESIIINIENINILLIYIIVLFVFIKYGIKGIIFYHYK